MDRALKNAPFTARVTFYVGSTGTDPTPDTCKIEVVGANGTVLVPAGTATVNDTATGPGVFAYTLTSTLLASLDILELRWTATVSGNVTILRTYVEVVGGFLCSLADIKTVFPGNTDAELSMMRTATEQRLENACRHAFVPRMKVETRSIRPRMRLAWPDIRVIRFASVGGVALSGSQVSNMNLSPGGIVYGLPGPPSIGYSLVTIGYEHGADYAPEVIREAMILAAQETFSSTDAQEGLIIRREADNQSVSYANPLVTTSAGSGTFQSPFLKRVVGDFAGPLVA